MIEELGKLKQSGVTEIGPQLGRIREQITRQMKYIQIGHCKLDQAQLRLVRKLETGKIPPGDEQNLMEDGRETEVVETHWGTKMIRWGTEVVKTHWGTEVVETHQGTERIHWGTKVVKIHWGQR